MKLSSLFSATALFLAAFTAANAQNVVAHRGFHLEKGVPENSIASLMASQRIGAWGSEFDIWLTADDVVVISHDHFYHTDSLKRVIKNTTYAELSDIRLSNGEPIPTFEAYVEQAAKVPSTKLICELKQHGDEKRDFELFDKAYKIIRKHKMEDQIVWQTFSYSLCKHARSVSKDAKVVYISLTEKGYKPASKIAADGISGVNYKYTLLDSHPEFMEEARKLGITYGLCIEDNPETIARFVPLGIYTIGTNRPDFFLWKQK